MTKFYCLLIDCTPFFDFIQDMGKKNNFTFLHHLSAGSTSNTLFTMLTGTFPCAIIPNGIGYLSHGDGDALNGHANKISLEAYKKRNGYYDDWKWLKNENASLFHILNNNNCKVKLHNYGGFGRFVKAKLGGLKYNPEDLSEFKNIETTYSHPKGISEEFMNSYGGFRYNSKSNHLIEEHFKLQKEYITNLQNNYKDENVFYIEDEHCYHDTAPDKINLIKRYFNLWNFNEPDSVFFIFADHGNTQSRLFPNEVNQVWAMIKDNRQNPLNFNNTFMASYDLFNTVLKVFNIKNTSPYPMLSKSLDNPLDKNRIFFIEDSRLKICNFESDTLNCFKIISWNGNIPKVMIQFTYIRGCTPSGIIDSDIAGCYHVFIKYDYDIKNYKWNKEKSYPCNLSNLSNTYLDQNIKEMFLKLRDRYKDYYSIDDLTNLNNYDLNKKVLTDGKNYWLVNNNKYRRLLISDNLDKKYNKFIFKIGNDKIKLIPKYQNNKIKNLNNVYYMQYEIEKEISKCILYIYFNFK